MKPLRASLESDWRSFRPVTAERKLYMRLLRYITTVALEGREAELKEYSLGVSGLGRPESFDPRTDPVVRLEARRLRLKLAEYYQHEGVDDPIVIELPKGAYVPHFRLRHTTAFQVPPAAPARPPRALWVSAAITVCGAILAAWFVLHKRSEAPLVRESVAILGFRDLSGNPATSWINPAISDLMNIELGAGQLVRTFPPENVARMRTELSLTPEPMYSTETLRRIGVNLGSDYAVAGAYLPSGDQVRLDVVLFDLRAARQVAAISESSDRARLLNMAQESARRLRAQLGVRLVTGPGAQANLPVTPAAMEAYSRGMDRLRQSDALGARPYLESAASLESSNFARCTFRVEARRRSMLGMDGLKPQERPNGRLTTQASSRVAWNSSRLKDVIARLRACGLGRFRCIRRCSPSCLTISNMACYSHPYRRTRGRLRTPRRRSVLFDAFPLLSRDDSARSDLAEAQRAGALSDFERTRQAAHAAAERGVKTRRETPVR